MRRTRKSKKGDAPRGDTILKPSIGSAPSDVLTAASKLNATDGCNRLGQGTSKRRGEGTHKAKIFLIKKTLKNAEYPLNPSEIAQKTGLKLGTVKPLLRERLGNEWVQDTRTKGYTVPENFPTQRGSMGWGKVFGEMGGSPRLHWFQLKVEGLAKRVRGSEVVAANEFYRVKFVWAGGGTVVVDVHCEKVFEGFDYAGFRAICDFVKAKLGVSSDDEVLLVNFHVNKDFPGMRLKGAQQVDLLFFDGVFKRFYNKTDNKLRVEVPKAGQLNVLQAFELLEKGGMSLHGSIQSNYALAQEVKRFVDAQKFQNELVQRMVNQNRSLIEFLFKERDERGEPKR